MYCFIFHVYIKFVKWILVNYGKFQSCLWMQISLWHFSLQCDVYTVNLWDHANESKICRFAHLQPKNFAWGSYFLSVVVSCLTLFVITLSDLHLLCLIYRSKCNFKAIIYIHVYVWYSSWMNIAYNVFILLQPTGCGEILHSMPSVYSPLFN